MGRLRSLRGRRDPANVIPAQLDVDIIHSELRRARRFEVPLSVAMFQWEAEPRVSIDEIGRRLQADLREFDYVVIDPVARSVSLWLFGTEREGAETKAARVCSDPGLASSLVPATVGFASFPRDGLTYESLVTCALAEIARARTDPAPNAAGDGRVTWQANVQNANSPSTS
jgi:hypothetical protein